MTSATLVEILLGVMTVLVGFAGYQLAARTARAQAQSSGKAVDAAAYDRARTIYEGAIGQLEQRIKGQGEQIEALQAETSRLREQNAQLGSEAASLRTELARWRGRAGRGGR